MVCLALYGCDRTLAERVSSQPTLQAKFETAMRSAAEIRRAKKRGRDVFADCKTVEMLLFKDLRQLEAAAAKRVLRELEDSCRDVKPP
jgi:hypothetical protein